MIYIRPGSHVLTLLRLLSTAGEYPSSSLYLLGNERAYKALVHRMTAVETYRDPHTETEVTGQMLRICGHGHAKSIRLNKRTALPILAHMGAADYYHDAYLKCNYSGGSVHRERNHRVAEAAAMCMRADIEFRPYVLPKLQNSRLMKVTPSTPSLYLSKSLKNIGQNEQNKTMFTRTVGAIFTEGTVYAVYNTRDAVMKWNGMGEFKALYSLIEVSRMNAGVPQVDSAIIFGQSDSVAMKTLLESDRSRRMEFRFDSIYRHIYFVPMNAFGIRLLRLLTLPDWNESVLSLLFEPDDRSYDRGTFEYDAYVNGRYIYSHLGGDIARLIRFREAISRYNSEKCEVVCFPEQAAFLSEYLGSDVSLKTIGMELIESELYPGRRTYE